MTPEEMDVLYPTMDPAMSRFVVDITGWLDASWSDEEMAHGKRMSLPLDDVRGQILRDYFQAEGRNVTLLVGPVSVYLTFLQ